MVFRATLGPDAGNPGAPYFRVLATGVQGDDFTVQYFDPDLGPGGTVLASDTLADIEHLVFDNGALDAENPVWVIEDGFLIGTFTSVAAAVALGNLASGVTVIEIGHGTIPPADYTEGAINITRAMTITGYGGPQTINSSSGVDLFVVSGAIASGTVTFADLSLSGRRGDRLRHPHGRQPRGGKRRHGRPGPEQRGRQRVRSDRPVRQWRRHRPRRDDHRIGLHRQRRQRQLRRHRRHPVLRIHRQCHPHDRDGHRHDRHRGGLGRSRHPVRRLPR